MLFVCYPKCTTCQRAKKFLDDRGVSYTERHIKENNPTAEELRGWWQASGLPLKKFFNTSGLLYKSAVKSAQLQGKEMDRTDWRDSIGGPPVCLC